MINAYYSHIGVSSLKHTSFLWINQNLKNVLLSFCLSILILFCQSLSHCSQTCLRVCTRTTVFQSISGVPKFTNSSFDCLWSKELFIAYCCKVGKKSTCSFLESAPFLLSLSTLWIYESWHAILKISIFCGKVGTLNWDTTGRNLKKEK